MVKREEDIPGIDIGLDKGGELNLQKIHLALLQTNFVQQIIKLTNKKL